MTFSLMGTASESGAHSCVLSVRAHCRSSVSPVCCCLFGVGRTNRRAFPLNWPDSRLRYCLIMLQMWDSEAGTELRPGCQGPSCFSSAVSV